MPKYKAEEEKVYDGRRILGAKGRTVKNVNNNNNAATDGRRNFRSHRSRLLRNGVNCLLVRMVANRKNKVFANFSKKIYINI